MNILERQQMTSGEQWNSISTMNGRIDELSRRVESLIDSQDAQAETGASILQC